MASTDLSEPAQHTEKQAQLDANQPDLKHDKDLTTGLDGVSDAAKSPAGRSRDASPASQASTSGFSSTKGGTQSPTPNAPPLSMPHPKKFSHVNISKKFLEKSTSASSPTHALSSSPVLKTANSTQRPAPQTATSHPRLVTAKLTATPQPSGTGGWSRPSSAVPSSTSTPLPAPISKPSTSSGSIAAAPLPPVGKVIQPQPRSQDAASFRKDASGRSVWGNNIGAGTTSAPNQVHADFPTAAEVAQGRVQKSSEKVPAPDAAVAHKQAVMAELIAEEDTFRGVHLDPNAHHWDEMEEDDDNFLGGVIEFEDGRQYNVQSNEAPSRDALASLAVAAPTDQPVSKEERFEDDFDRSWPRSRSGGVQPTNHLRDQRPGGSTAPPSSASAGSPQESSRVLFNERSNRLEPYSHQRQVGPAAPPFPNRRNSRSDYSVSPTEPRRDAPPHTHLQGVQLLQKGPNGGSPHGESPTFSRAPGDRSPLFPSDGSRFRDRPPMRRDHPAWQANGTSLPEQARHGSSGMSQPSGRLPRDSPSEERTHRHAFDPPSSPDHRRQLPPHLSNAGPRHVPPIRTDSDTFRSPVAPLDIPLHPESSAPSASSQAADSPAAASVVLPVGDVEEVRKAAMHSAAERARLRRQQEEEEREKEKERARKKAAEIEARIKALEEAKAREREKADVEKQQAEAQVLGIIEEAVSSVLPPDKHAGPADGVHDDASQRTTSTRPPMGRVPSSRGGTRPPFAPRRSSITAPVAPSSASEVDTWRRKNPPTITPVPAHVDRPEPAAPALLPTTTLAHAHLDVKEGEDVDVVDFADLGKLVGSESSSQHPDPARPIRAVASDFFDEAPTSHRPQPPPSKADEGPWRRRPSVVHSYPLPDKPAAPSDPDVCADVSFSESVRSADPSAQPPLSSPVQAYEDHHRRGSGQYQNGIHKLPPGPHYREAPMSTLNDVMARIKGAIDGMHNHEVDVQSEPSPDGAPKEAVVKEVVTEPPKEMPRTKWLPPALRPRSAHPEFAHPTEVFDVTASEPPKSPKRAWNIYTVKISHDHRPSRPPPKSELIWPRGQRLFRLDVYSLGAENRREGSFNDFLYGRPRFIKGQPKYFVSLPRRRLERRRPVETTPASPVVNLPITPPRTRNADPSPTWRKPAIVPMALSRPHPGEELGLDTVSRSPPPEAPSSATVAKPADPSATAPRPAAVAQSRLPIGSEVAFYHTGRSQVAADAPVHVPFAVSSELGSDSKLGLITGDTPVASVLSGSTVVPNPISLPAKAPPLDLKSEAVGLGLTNGSSSPPPPSQPTVSPWSKSPKAFTVKDSPSRAPDPEHLKAVWSQTPEKAQSQPVNSLKGIADDLTGIPFTLHDVKSDDGETPPPSSTGLRSKMSAYDVTRAFQQVPSSSTSTPQRPVPAAPTLTPSASATGPPRNPTFAFSPPPPMARPAYPTYSPMMSSPSPGVMYSQQSPVPRPMVINGSAPAYGQPMWMPAMPGPPPPQSGMMRSPYPAQLLPYPSPGGAMPMYPSPMPGMQNTSPQQNGMQSRPPGMPMVSPVMQHALPPMYAGSPVLVPAPPGMQPGQGYPMPVPVPGQQNRGPPMRPFEQNPGTPNMAPPPMRQQAPNGYNPVMSNYARPW